MVEYTFVVPKTWDKPWWVHLTLSWAPRLPQVDELTTPFTITPLVPNPMPIVSPPDPPVTPLTGWITPAVGEGPPW